MIKRFVPRVGHYNGREIALALPVAGIDRLHPMPARIGSLYVCYLTITDPLVETQVIAYLEGLARAGHRIHLLTFEPKGAPSDGEWRGYRDRLAERGITLHRARYRKRPSLPATIADVFIGAFHLRRITRRHRLSLVHARSHVPAAMALIARRIGAPPFAFDIRGMMAEEYVDAGRWTPGGVPFRITKRVERRAIDRCDGAVVLTEDARDLLLSNAGSLPVEVIPCCVDLTNFPDRQGLGDRTAPIFAYVGKFGGWYMEAEMARLFSRALARWPNAQLRIFTQSDPRDVQDELAKAQIDPAHVAIGRVPADHIGEELVQADVGLSLVRPVPSKIASSPTKNAEYLAAGLPLLATSGVAGTDDLAASFPGIVIAMQSFDDRALDAALEGLRALLADPATLSRCREAARSMSLDGRGVPGYERLYGAIAERVGA